MYEFQPIPALLLLSLSSLLTCLPSFPAARTCFGVLRSVDAPRSRAARTAYHHQLSVHGRHQAGAKWAAATTRQGHLEVEGGGYGSYQHVQGIFGCWVWEGLPYYVCSFCQSDYVCTGQVPGKAGLPAGFNRYALRPLLCISPTLLQRTT